MRTPKLPIVLSKKIKTMAHQRNFCRGAAGAQVTLPETFAGMAKFMVNKLVRGPKKYPKFCPNNQNNGPLIILGVQEQFVHAARVTWPVPNLCPWGKLSGQ